MKPAYGICMAGIALLMAQGGSAGEIIGFDPTRAALADPVLQHVDELGIVCEFLDPGEKRLGKSIGALIWREVLNAISDQRGAGVVFARSEDWESLKLLETEYHRAAEEITRRQNARMCLWGTVREEEDRVFIRSYVTMPSDTEEHGLSLELDQIPEIDASISASRFNFAMIASQREQLFDRPIVTRSSTRLRSGPGTNTETLEILSTGTLLRSIDMSGHWFEVELGERRGFVRSDLVDVPPRTAFGRGKRIHLREGPGTDHAIVQQTQLEGRYYLEDARYREGQGLWYQIRVDDEPVWVAAYLVDAEYSHPAVHFLAGMYRFLLGSFHLADREFGSFERIGGDRQSHVVRSAALQLRGASKFLDRTGQADALRLFDEAVSLTPYDPQAYRVRALGRIGVGEGLMAALEDVEHALGLDPLDEASTRLAGGFESLIAPEASGDLRTELLALDSAVYSNPEPLRDRLEFVLASAGRPPSWQSVLHSSPALRLTLVTPLHGDISQARLLFRKLGGGLESTPIDSDGRAILLLGPGQTDVAVTVSHPDYRPDTRVFSVSAGDTLDRVIELVPSDCWNPAPEGSVALDPIVSEVLHISSSRYCRRATIEWSAGVAMSTGRGIRAILLHRTGAASPFIEVESCEAGYNCGSTSEVILIENVDHYFKVELSGPGQERGYTIKATIHNSP